MTERTRVCFLNPAGLYRGKSVDLLRKVSLKAYLIDLSLKPVTKPM